MADFRARLTCRNCQHSWEDHFKGCEDEPISDLVQVMIALAQAEGCPDCGWTEIALKLDGLPIAAVSLFNGIRGEDEFVNEYEDTSYGCQGDEFERDEPEDDDFEGNSFFRGLPRRMG